MVVCVVYFSVSCVLLSVCQQECLCMCVSFWLRFSLLYLFPPAERCSVQFSLWLTNPGPASSFFSS